MTEKEVYTVAVDLGTTTLVLYLLREGLKGYTVCQAVSEENPQQEFGKDVISRISYIGEDKKKLETFQRLIADTCSFLIRQMCERQDCHSGQIRQIVFAGNPTMCHILLGYLPLSLAEAPFSHQYQGSWKGKGSRLHISGFEAAEIYVLPGIGQHVGADTVAAMVATISQNSGRQLLVDIGTNGEIVIEKDGEYFACSAAAGPALEGGEISQGMVAKQGAITEVTFDKEQNRYCLNWIGKETGEKPFGICGSGLVDAVAALCEMGVLEESGRLLPANVAKEKGVPYSLTKRLVEIEGQQAFVLYIEREVMLAQAVGTPDLFVRYVKEQGNSVILLTQQDIRAVQLAKGALFAAMKVLLKVAGLQIPQVERVYVAGAFGNYIRPESAVRIGLFPEEWIGKLLPCGNAAGEGCCKVAMEPEMKKWAEKIPERVRHIPLANSKVFQEYYLDAMHF